MTFDEESTNKLLLLVLLLKTGELERSWYGVLKTGEADNSEKKCSLCLELNCHYCILV